MNCSREKVGGFWEVRLGKNQFGKVLIEIVGTVKPLYLTNVNFDTKWENTFLFILKGIYNVESFKIIQKK